MDCAEVRNIFVAGRVPAGPEAEAHLAVCGPCHELFESDARLGRGLAQGAASPDIALGDLFAQVENDVKLEVGLRARLRALPMRARVASLLGVAFALLIFQLVLRRRLDFDEYSPGVFWGVASVLTVALAIGAVRVMRGVNAPLRSLARERGIAIGLLLAPALVALLAPFGAASPEAARAWSNPAGCFSYGAALVVPLVLLYWLFERRGRPPFSTLVLMGGLLGLAANLLLHAHCSSAHVGHILLGHASIGVVWALALGLVWGSPQPSR